MKEESTKPQQPADPNLDIPAEANREKHINFRDAEERSNTNRESDTDDFAAERRKQWNEGLEEGRNALRDNE